MCASVFVECIYPVLCMFEVRHCTCWFFLLFCSVSKAHYVNAPDAFRHKTEKEKKPSRCYDLPQKHVHVCHCASCACLSVRVFLLFNRQL